MLEARDLDRPLSRDLTPLDAVVEVADSDCPDEWSRYCDLAHHLVQPREISQEDAARKLLAANSERLHQKFGPIRTLPPTKLEIMEDEVRKLEGLFRDRLHLALEKGRYLLKASQVHDLEPHTVPLALIKPKHFRFDSQEMELSGIKVIGVHFVRTISGPQTDPPGRKPGQMSVKDLACKTALSILNDEARRPLKRHGRLSALARMVHAVLEKDGKPYAVDSIVKYIRGTVKEWQARNPEK